jgi:hypothetical protein
MAREEEHLRTEPSEHPPIQAEAPAQALDGKDEFIDVDFLLEEIEEKIAPLALA